MKLEDLRPAPGTKTVGKRRGLGLGSGNGKTAGKGNKGSKARKSPDIGANFEGGQMPLARRMPKRGFNNYEFAVKYQIVNVSDLDARFEAGADIDAVKLYAIRLISDVAAPVKVLGEGDVTKSLNVKANAFSASAAKKIEAAGGKAEVI